MKKSFCCVLMLLSSLAAHAEEDSGGPTISIQGFGSAALTRSNTDDAEFSRPYQAAGVTTKAQTGVDSNFGIQATAKFSPMLSVTGQGLVRKLTRDDFTAELAWAFVKLKASDELSFKIGRVGSPTYLISDFRNVGYANTMLRPPNEVYRQVPIDTYEGVDALYQSSFGDTNLTAQFGLGRSKVRFADGSGLVARPLVAVNVIAENGPLTLRFGRTQATFSLTDSAGLPGLLGALRATGFSGVADEIQYTDVKGAFTALGLVLDWKNMLVQSEYAVRTTSTRLVTDSTSWYAMFGYRFGKFTPYFTHGATRQDSIRSFAALPSSGPLAGLAAGVNGAIKGPQFSNNSIGVRWDFNKSADFKLQFDRVTPKDGTGGFLNAKPGFTGPVNVLAATIDFVF